jgi:glycosyltransferase involved in cell wall biosynthesis
MSLRIAHVTATFPPYHGGTGNVCYHHARELARRGHDVQVFTAAMPGAPARELCEGFMVRRLRPALRVGNAPLLPHLLSVLRGFDVIHLHYPYILGAEIVRLASIVYRVPLVISFHNDLIGRGTRALLFALYQRLSASLTVRGAARLCAVSLDHYESSKLRRALADGGPLAVELPNGVDVSHFRPCAPGVDVRRRYGIPAEATVVLFAAALDRAHHFKGLGTLLQAMRLLPSNVWLLVVGDGDLRETYMQQATIPGIAGRVVFAGSIDHADMPPFFCSAELTVLPSSPPESFGLVLF